MRVVLEYAKEEKKRKERLAQEAEDDYHPEDFI